MLLCIEVLCLTPLPFTTCFALQYNDIIRNIWNILKIYRIMQTDCAQCQLANNLFHQNLLPTFSQQQAKTMDGFYQLIDLHLKSSWNKSCSVSLCCCTPLQSPINVYSAHRTMHTTLWWCINVWNAHSCINVWYARSYMWIRPTALSG